MKSVSSASLWSSHFLEFLLLLYPGFLQWKEKILRKDIISFAEAIFFRVYQENPR
jgi:hypothetical protein